MFFSLLCYNLILLFSIIFSYFSEWSINITQRLLCRCILFLILFLPAAFRFGIGTDYNTYLGIYNGNVYSSLEPGFLFLINISHFLGFSAVQFICLMSFITLFPICFLLNRKYFCWFIPLYVMLFYFQTYSLLRQALSVTFLICSIQYFIDQKYYKLFICFAIAFLFHFSAILLLPIFCIGKIKISAFWAFLFTVAFVIFIFKFNFFEILFNSSIYQSSKYAGYENSLFGSETSLGSGTGVIGLMLFPLCFILFSKNIISKNKNASILVVLSIFFIVAQVLSAKIHIFNRVLDTVRYLPMFLLPYFYYRSRISYKTPVSFLFIILTFILFEKNLSASRSDVGSGLGILPYVSIFDN